MGGGFSRPCIPKALPVKGEVSLLRPILIRAMPLKVASEDQQEERKTQNDLTGLSVKQARTVTVLRIKSI